MTDDTHPSSPKKQTDFLAPAPTVSTMTCWSFGGHAMVRHANRRSTCTVSGALGDNNPTPRAHGPRAP